MVNFTIVFHLLSGLKISVGRVPLLEAGTSPYPTADYALQTFLVNLLDFSDSNITDLAYQHQEAFTLKSQQTNKGLYHYFG